MIEMRKKKVQQKKKKKKKKKKERTRFAEKSPGRMRNKNNNRLMDKHEMSQYGREIQYQRREYQPSAAQQKIKPKSKPERIKNNNFF
jgi:hypothetical protein